MRKWLFFLCLPLLLLACNSSNNQLANDIQTKGADQAELIQTYNKADSLYQQGVISRELFDEFITQTIKFADTYPENEITPDMLSKAGVACMILAKNCSMEQQPDQEAIEMYARKGLSIFEKIQATYPDYEGVRNCYLNRAFIYDDILN